MADTITAPATSGTPAAPAIPVTPAPAPVDPKALYAAASEGLTGETWDTPAAEAPKAETPQTPAEGTETAPEFVQDEQGRWHRPDGTFANETELAEINAQLASEPAPDAKTEPAKEEAEQPAANTVTLRRRDGSTREVQVDDPELADEIRANFNDGMRRKEYAERSAQVEERLAHLTQVQATLQESPETFVYQELTDEQRINLGVMLLARDFDRLIPVIQQFDQNPGKRIEETAAAGVRIKQAETRIQQMAEFRRTSSQIRQSLESMIPDNAPESDVAEFMQLAGALLGNHITAGATVNATTAPKLVSGLAARYGFTTAAQTAPAKPRITAVAPANSTTSTPAVAQPANDAAKQLAEASRQQRRIKLTQKARTNAAAIPPAGAGAAPLRLPPAPKGASIEEASAGLRQLGRTWTN